MRRARTFIGTMRLRAFHNVSNNAVSECVNAGVLR
jgi:hypothetical protein